MARTRDTFDSGSFRGVASFRSGLVDHRMARRHLINEYHRGRLGREEVCDAHPELMRAARGVGKQTETRCPICVESNLVLVTYVFGPRLAAHGKVVADNNVTIAGHPSEYLKGYNVEKTLEVCCASLCLCLCVFVLCAPRVTGGGVCRATA